MGDRDFIPTENGERKLGRKGERERMGRLAMQAGRRSEFVRVRMERGE